MISTKYRFHGHGSIRYVYANGKAVRSHFVTIKSVNNPRRKYSRISVVVSKKVHKGAVGRNRIRRRLYEYVRLHLSQFNDVYDIALIVTSAEVRTMPAEDLEAHLDQLFEKAGLYKTSEI